MHKLTNWEARRSGPQITVIGTDEGGVRRRVGVKKIFAASTVVAGAEGVFGLLPDGDTLRLA